MQRRNKKPILALWAALLAWPSVGLALTNGPSMPEYNDFAPVDATDLVNLVSGDFSYSIPVMTVPGPGLGFPLVLGYNAGILQKQEASWTGLGWNLQAGAITRQVNQVPDDFKGDVISETIKSNTIHGWFGSISYDGVTIGVSWDNVNGTGGMVGYSFSLAQYGGPKWLGVGVQAGVNGIYEGVGVSLSVMGSVGGKNPGDIGASAKASIGLSSKSGFTTKAGTGLSVGGEKQKNSNEVSRMSLASIGASLSSKGGLNGSANLGVMFSQQSTTRGQMHSRSGGGTIPFWFYGYGEISWGNWAYWVEGHGKNRYYGFLYEDKEGMDCQGQSAVNVDCSDHQNLSDKKMEFIGFKEAFRQPLPGADDYPKLMAASPDVYSVATQGLSGVFRPGRKEDGDYLNNLGTRRSSYQASCDVPFIGFLTSCTRHRNYNRTSVLESEKDLHNDTEQGMGDVVWRFMDDFGGAEYTKPDWRDQSAEVSVQSKQIYPYFDAAGKISGFEITKEDGVKYVYGFALNNRGEMKLAHQNGGDLNVATSQTTPTYAYAWLLTAIHSPDYVDMTPLSNPCQGGSAIQCPENGDLGGWVRFHYGIGNSFEQDLGLGEKTIYNWRTPYMGATNAPVKYLPSPYIEGTDGDGNTEDDGYKWKISHTASEGVKEVAYLMKVETPSHLARFHMSERLDGKQSVLTKLQRDPPEVVEDFVENQVKVFKEDMVIGRSYTVQIKHRINVMRNEPAGCTNSGVVRSRTNLTRNNDNFANTLLNPADLDFIERSGRQSDPGFYGNCLNDLGDFEICKDQLYIEEVTQLSELVTATAGWCPVSGGADKKCLIVFQNKLKLPAAFEYTNPASSDPLETPNAFGPGSQSLHEYYVGYCSGSNPRPVRYYAERRVEAVTFVETIQDIPPKKLDFITLHNKLEESEQVSAVEFKYDYSLVPGTPNSDAPNAGKLTLRSVRIGATTFGPWLPAYKFGYQAYNPGFRGNTTAKLNYETQEGWDRWGYHCASCIFNQHEPDGSAAAWNLEEVVLPSGGRIKLEYEPKLYHTTLVLDHGSIVPKDLTDRSGTGNPILGATRNGMIIYRPDQSSDPFNYPDIQGQNLSIKQALSELGIDAQQKGREIDYYGIKLEFERLMPPDFETGAFLLLTTKGVSGSPITTGNGPVIPLKRILRSDMKDFFNPSQTCAITDDFCNYETSFNITPAEYELIKSLGFEFSIFSYKPACTSQNSCDDSEYCSACHQFYPDGYRQMKSWFSGDGSGTGTTVRYEVKSWLTPRNSRIGGGVRVAKLSTIEPISGLANAIHYAYGDGITPTMPATFGTFDDRKIDGTQLIPVNVGYEHFVGNPGVTYEKVSTEFVPASGASYRTDYHFITAKDLPTQFQLRQKVEFTQELTGNYLWEAVEGGVFLGPSQPSASKWIDLEPLRQEAIDNRWKIEEYRFEFKLSDILSSKVWRTSATTTVTDPVPMNCRDDLFTTYNYPFRYLMLDGYISIVYGHFETEIVGSNSILPVAAVNPGNVSLSSTADNSGCVRPGDARPADGPGPFYWPDPLTAPRTEWHWQGASVSVRNGIVFMNIPGEMIESYRAAHGVLHIEPRLVRKLDENAREGETSGYAVQNFHLEYKVTAIGSPVNTPRHFYRVYVQDYSSLWGNLWKKEDYAANSTTPVRVNLVKWGFNDGWMSMTPNSGFVQEDRHGTAVWTRRLGGASSVPVLESYSKRDGKPFVKTENSVGKAYFGLNQSLASYRYFGNNCDAEVNKDNACQQKHIIVTQTVHQRFLPHVVENITIQDGLAASTYSTYYDFLTGAPLKTRKVNSDQSVTDVYTQPAHFQYPDMANANQLTQAFGTTTYHYPTSPPALTADPVAANAVAATYTRWRPFASGGAITPYRQSEQMTWRNLSASGESPASFTLPDDRCPENAVPDEADQTPMSHYCADETAGMENWVSGGRNSLYDPFGHVSEFTKPNGTRIGHLYAYNTGLQSAVGTRAGHDELFYESFETRFEAEGRLVPDIPQANHLPVTSNSKTGAKSLMVESHPAGENAVCYRAPLLQDRKAYTASVWYYDASSGASHSDPQATRAGLFLGDPNGCHAEVFPDGFGGQAPADPGHPARATGSKTWKRLDVRFECADPGHDPAQMRVCLYASREGTGANIYYDELRVSPSEAMMSTFAYDLNGNMISSADPNEVVTHYEYDPFGNLTGIRNDDGVLLGSKAQQYGRTGK